MFFLSSYKYNYLTKGTFYTYLYTYDNIGNRQQATKGNDVTGYDANALIQYTAISFFVPGFQGASTRVPKFEY